MRIFVWVYSVTPWSTPKCTAQIITDIEQFEYAAAQNKWKVQHRREIADGVTLDDIISVNPAPEPKMEVL